MLLAFRVAAQVKFLTNSLGLYIHIPFCEKKCNYCDFYSAFYNKDTLSVYLTALKGEIKKWGGKLDRPIDTVYIGGGTPSLLGEEIIPLLDCVKANFTVLDNAEITVEANPSSSDDFLEFAKCAGVNRLSIGVQSGCDDTLKTLGRTHTSRDAAITVQKARKLGFDNISLDLMIALPNSNLQTLKNDIDFIFSLNPEHISSYILKIEQNTAFFKKLDALNLPDDDLAAEQYLYMCDAFEKNGYNHYEISNFSRENKESRHNIKYWLGEDYLGLGPAAHSCLDGKRFYYPRDLMGFIKNPQTVYDGEAGGKQEALMLGLRLSRGVDLSKIYGEIPEMIRKKVNLLENAGYIKANLPHISLTNSGMLISNSIITELLITE